MNMSLLIDTRADVSVIPPILKQRSKLKDESYPINPFDAIKICRYWLTQKFFLIFSHCRCQSSNFFNLIFKTPSFIT